MKVNINNLREFVLANSSFTKKEFVDAVIDKLKFLLIENRFDLENLEVAVGESSINFLKEDIVLRMTYVRYDNLGYNTLSEYVSHSDAIIHPISEMKLDLGEVNNPTFLILKRLTVGNVTEKERNMAYIKLRLDGYLFNDVEKYENFGKDESGNVYLLDYGELMYIADKEKANNSDPYFAYYYNEFVKRELKNHINRHSDYNKKYQLYLRRKNAIEWMKHIKGYILTNSIEKDVKTVKK